MKMFSLLLKIKLRLFYKLQKMGGKKKKAITRTPRCVCCDSARRALQRCFSLNSSQFQTLDIIPSFEG